jgi:hypothetical protein
MTNTKLRVDHLGAAPGIGALDEEEDEGGGRHSVQRGAGGDAYHMPAFSGLCSYIFGKNAAGNLDPSNIGIANPKFMKNAGLIDQ